MCRMFSLLGSMKLMKRRRVYLVFFMFSQSIIFFSIVANYQCCGTMRLGQQTPDSGVVRAVKSVKVIKRV